MHFNGNVPEFWACVPQKHALNVIGRFQGPDVPDSLVNFIKLVSQFILKHIQASLTC